jgi:hypothetical protein
MIKLDGIVTFVANNALVPLPQPQGRSGGPAV